MAHLSAPLGSPGQSTGLYKRQSRYFCVLGCEDVAFGASTTTLDQMKQHYVKQHGQLELCLWGIDKHTLTVELQMPVKHLKLE